MESIEKGDDDSGLKSLIDLAEACPKFLRPQLDQLFAACIKVFSDANQEDSWRHLALEIVVTMSETAPAMVRKVAGGQLEAAIAAILRMMTEIEMIEDLLVRWHARRFWTSCQKLDFTLIKFDINGVNFV